MELAFDAFATDSIINFGTIAARATAKSYAEADVYGGSVVNAGTIEALANSAGASPHGAFVYLSGTVNNTSGLILASETGGSAAVDINSATISGGMLKTSGAQAAIYANGAFVGGVMIAAGSLIEETSGAALMLDSATIGSGAIVETASGGTAIVSGTVSNSGTLFASGSGSLVEIVSGAVVSGGAVKVGNGIVDVLSGGSANVSFLAPAAAGWKSPIPPATTSAFTGRVSGFGGANHSNHKQFIDLISVTSAPGRSLQLRFRPPATPAERCSSPAAARWWLHQFVGAYSAGDFSVTVRHQRHRRDHRSGGGQRRQRRHPAGRAFPRHGIDLPNIAFGAQTTLAYSENSFVAGDSLRVTDGRHAADHRAPRQLHGRELRDDSRRPWRHVDFRHAPTRAAATVDPSASRVTGGPAWGPGGRSRQRWQRPRDCPCHRCTAHTCLAAPRVCHIAPRAFTSVERFRAPSSRHRGKTAATTGTERMREHRERDRGDCPSLPFSTATSDIVTDSVTACDYTGQFYT